MDVPTLLFSHSQTSIIHSGPAPCATTVFESKLKEMHTYSFSSLSVVVRTFFFFRVAMS